jgi:hypothetical protein
MADSPMEQHPSATRARWFGVPARWIIVVFLALYAAGTLAFRAIHTEDPHARFQHLVGQPYADFAFYFGPPEREQPDGERGTIFFYNDIAVAGDRFVESPFRLHIDRRGRIYRIEFD